MTVGSPGDSRWSLVTAVETVGSPGDSRRSLVTVGGPSDSRQSW